MFKLAYFKQLGYTPHSGQMKFHTSQARFRAMNCGRRWGKSLSLARDLEPELLLPNRTYWIVAPTYDLGEKEFKVIWQDMIVKQQLGKDPRVEKSYSKRQGNMHIKFKDRNTVLEVRSADNPELLVGEALDGALFSEAARHKQDTWEQYIRPALSDRRGWATFGTTPLGFNWYYDLWMFGKDDSLPEYESWIFPSWGNTVMYPDGADNEEIQLMKRTMGPEAFMQEIGAEFGSFVGKIYPEWDVNEHVKKVEYNPAWPNYIAFDWGYANPMAAVEFQISPRDEIHIWREHYKPFTRLSDFLQEMKNREQPDGYRINLTFGDAADPEAVQTVNVEFAPCIADPNSKTNWRDGVDLIRGFLRDRIEVGEDEYGGPIDRPVFFVDPKCTNIIREFNNYKTNESIKGKNVPEMGSKIDDHALDAFRYGMVHIYRLGAIRGLAEVMSSTPADQYNQTNLPAMAGSSALSSDNTGGYFTSDSHFTSTKEF